MSCRTFPAFIASCTAGIAAAGAIAAEPSSGCKAPPESPPETFHVAGRERHAIVVVPEGCQADRPHALVFGFHGRTNDNTQARAYFGLEEAANGPTIYIYPAALTDRSGRFTWTDPGDTADALRDFALPARTFSAGNALNPLSAPSRFLRPRQFLPGRCRDLFCSTSTAVRPPQRLSRRENARKIL